MRHLQADKKIPGMHPHANRGSGCFSRQLALPATCILLGEIQSSATALQARQLDHGLRLRGVPQPELSRSRFSSHVSEGYPPTGQLH